MEYQSGAVQPIESFGDGWNIIKNDYWMYVLMVFVGGLILLITSLVLSFITNLISGGIASVLGVATSNSGEIARTSAVVIPQIIAQVVSFFTNIILVTMTGIFYCGIYKSMSRVANGGRADFGDLFGGFENLLACFIFAVVYSVIQFIIAIGVLLGFAAIGFSAIGLTLKIVVTSDGQINPAVLSGLLLVFLAYLGVIIVIGLITSALTAFVYPLIGERNLPGLQAFLLSIKGGFANLVGLIALIVIGGLMLFFAALPCLTGLPFVAPFYIAALFASYRRVFGSFGGYNQYNPPPPPKFGQQPGY